MLQLVKLNNVELCYTNVFNRRSKGFALVLIN